ncbi:MAG: hypothetical protein V3T95_04300, partial [Acidobacteriota bacterium]
DRIIHKDISPEELVHFLDIVEDRIRSMVDTDLGRRMEALPVHERRKLIKGHGSQVDEAIKILDDYLESYLSQETDTTEKPN